MVRLLALCLVVLLLGGCAEHAHALAPYGFFSGLWHGLIFPSLFARQGPGRATSSTPRCYDGRADRRRTRLLYYVGYGIGLRLHRRHRRRQRSANRATSARHTPG